MYIQNVAFIFKFLCNDTNRSRMLDTPLNNSNLCISIRISNIYICVYVCIYNKTRKLYMLNAKVLNKYAQRLKYYEYVCTHKLSQISKNVICCQLSKTHI